MGRTRSPKSRYLVILKVPGKGIEMTDRELYSYINSDYVIKTTVTGWGEKIQPRILILLLYIFFIKQ